jgi:hypothetical protein
MLAIPKPNHLIVIIIPAVYQNFLHVYLHSPTHQAITSLSKLPNPIQPPPPTLRPISIEPLRPLRRDDIPILTRREGNRRLIRIERIEARVQRFSKTIHFARWVEL